MFITFHLYELAFRAYPKQWPVHHPLFDGEDHLFSLLVYFRILGDNCIIMNMSTFMLNQIAYTHVNRSFLDKNGILFCISVYDISFRSSLIVSHDFIDYNYGPDLYSFCQISQQNYVVQLQQYKYFYANCLQ